MGTPFDDYTFGEQDQQAKGNLMDPNLQSAEGGVVPEIVSADDIVRVLNGLSGPAKLTSAQNGASGGKPVSEVGGSAGAKRVNDNTGQTGVVAYRDDKGQMVLTNVARDASGKESPIMKGGNQNGSKQGNAGDTQLYPQSSTISTDVTTAFARLRNTTDPNAAAGINESLTTTLNSEQSRIEQEAFRFAESKLGIPELKAEIEAARQADRADPLFVPGIGDSPVTKGLIARLDQLNRDVDNQAKNFLGQNAGYKNVISKKTELIAQMKRIETAAYNADMLDTQLTLRTKEEGIRKQADFERDMLNKYEGLTNSQLARIELLEAPSLAGFKDMADADRKKVKIFSLVAKKAKDKDWAAAVDAPDNGSLLNLAVTGNNYAKTILVSQESTNTGKSVREIELELQSFKSIMNNPNLPIEVNKLRSKAEKPEEVNRQKTELMISKNSADAATKIKYDQTRVALFNEYMTLTKTAHFMGDVSSWGSTDPQILTAIDATKKVTGNAKIGDVFGAYLEGAADSTDRKFRIDSFRNALVNAANKQSKSAFGVINYRQAEAMLVEQMVEKGLISKLFTGAGKAIGDAVNTGLANASKNAPLSVFAATPLNPLIQSIDLIDRETRGL